MTTTEIVARPHTSGLAIQDGQTFWTDEQLSALAQLGVKDAPRGDLAVFFHQAARTGLDPFARQIYMIGRQTQENGQWVTRYTIQTGIDGYRLVARRAVEARGETLEYEDTLWCGEDGRWVDVWLKPEPPAAAKVTVLRDGKRFSAVALWSEYVQTVTDRRTGERRPNAMWERMKASQLAKCAEALALRKAFPQDLSGLYTTEEMGQSDGPGRPAVEAQQVDSQARPAAVEAGESRPVAAHPSSRRRPPPLRPVVEAEPADQPEAEAVAQPEAEPEPLLRGTTVLLDERAAKNRIYAAFRESGLGGEAAKAAAEAAWEGHQAPISETDLAALIEELDL